MIETPAAIVDLDRLERNLALWQEECDRLGLSNRPHVKTHKCVAIAQRQVELGARGVTCQTLFEAETMVDAGIDDVLVPVNILGAAKLARLAALLERAQVTVSVDDARLLPGLAGAARARPLVFSSTATRGSVARVSRRRRTPPSWQVRSPAPNACASTASSRIPLRKQRRVSRRSGCAHGRRRPRHRGRLRRWHAGHVAHGRPRPHRDRVSRRDVRVPRPRHRCGRSGHPRRRCDDGARHGDQLPGSRPGDSRRRQQGADLGPRPGRGVRGRSSRRRERS